MQEYPYGVYKGGANLQTMCVNMLNSAAKLVILT